MREYSMSAVDWMVAVLALAVWVALGCLLLGCPQ